MLQCCIRSRRVGTDDIQRNDHWMIIYPLSIGIRYTAQSQSKRQGKARQARVCYMLLDRRISETVGKKESDL